jgi:hypothetical protein
MIRRILLHDKKELYISLPMAWRPFVFALLELLDTIQINL